MTTRTRALRNLAVYAAGFLPFALFWRSIGFVPSVLIGVIAMLVVALIFRRHDAKPARPGRATNSPDRGNDDRRTMGACHSCRSTSDRLGGYGPSGIGGSVVHRSGHVHRDLHYRAVRTQGTSPEPRQLRGRRKQLAPNVCVSYRRPSQPVCCGDLFLGIRRHGARSLSPVAPPQVKAPESEGHRE